MRDGIEAGAALARAHDGVLDAARAARRRGRVALRAGGRRRRGGAAHGPRCGAAMRGAPVDPAALRAIAAPPGRRRGPAGPARASGTVTRRAARGTGAPTRRASWDEVARRARGEACCSDAGRRASSTGAARVCDEDDAAAAGRPRRRRRAEGERRSLQHKTEIGGVELGLRPRATRRARRLPPARARGRRARRRSCWLERMAAPGRRADRRRAARRVVPALVVGLGGRLDRTARRRRDRAAPGDAPRVERALRSLRGARCCWRARARAPSTSPPPRALAARLGAPLLELDLELIEFNPVIAGRRGAVAVDAVVRLRRGLSAERRR